MPYQYHYLFKSNFSLQEMSKKEQNCPTRSILHFLTLLKFRHRVPTKQIKRNETRSSKRIIEYSISQKETKKKRVEIIQNSTYTVYPSFYYFFEIPIRPLYSASYIKRILYQFESNKLTSPFLQQLYDPVR